MQKQSTHTRKPAQSALADLGQKFSLFFTFLHVERPLYLIIQLIVSVQFYRAIIMLQKYIDAQHRWRRKPVVSDIGHITAGYTKFSNRVTI